MYTKIAPITINTKKKAGGAAEIFIAEPTPAREQLAGKLFILIEVEARKNDAQKIIDFIVSDINENYYQNDKLMLREKIEALKIENIFETVLVKTNKNLIDFLAEEKIILSPKSINATIGIIFGNELHFSNIGSNQALLLYKEETDSKYKMINVEKSEDAKDSSGDNLNFKKLFSSIISGEMPAKSYFIFANEALSEYLFNQELIEIITKLAPLGAAEQIKHTLFKINAYIPFMGIIIKNNFNHEEPENIEEYRQVEASRSISEQKDSNLTATAEKTEQILTPASVVNTRRVSGFCVRILKKINPFRLIGKLFKLIFKKKEHAANIPTTTLDRTALSAETSKNTSKIKKILLIILALALLAFLINLGIQKIRTKNTEQTQENKNYEEVIKQKESQVESYLLYNDEKSAKGILEELKNYLDGIPEDKKAKIENYNELLAKYNDQMSQVQHITKVDQLKIVADFSAIGSDLNIENIMLIGDKVYAADNGQKAIYRLNSKDNISAVISSEQIKSYLKYPTANKDGLIYYLDENQVVVLNPKDEKLAINKMALTEGQNLIGLYNYTDKLYALDKAKNQLYRYVLTGSEYPKAESRLKSKLDASDVTYFTIDNEAGAEIGTMYFLKSSGEVKKFYAGIEDNKFTIDSIEPKITGATMIKVLTDIYILDPANKRLAVFTRKGKTKKQYQSEQLAKLKDFSVDEKSKKAYLLSDNIVYELPL
ncbi:hypothetical protein COX21_03910 [Candidatus Falkowbacteria bacterium CG23_combo_of_CG06-09_8_20_14_all_41_10]|uniref:Uncharacterized protein n=1 Tax=Candidatus Falkowbacteria bacterium CG23_combo_of_CG06-09_8_20_14_all_41_10 TaxID=1974571 RepID=A0A2G9ZMC5_9BACT|nr:MAG: hypothetical protein COX21_03910 [Candidatus Falkowbacteria bacterium CG23_combo_of_CG06-09_8_20_14_all_41_10]